MNIVLGSNVDFFYRFLLFWVFLWFLVRYMEFDIDIFVFLFCFIFIRKFWVGLLFLMEIILVVFKYDNYFFFF